MMQRMMRVLVAVVVALLIGLMIAKWASAETKPVFMSLTDIPACTALRNAGAVVRDEPGGCRVRLGRLDVRDDAVVYYPAPWVERRIAAPPTPTPSPQPSPTPTNAQGPCVNKNPAYCWAKGAFLSIGGYCRARCECILRGSGECAS